MAAPDRTMATSLPQPSVLPMVQMACKYIALGMARPNHSTPDATATLFNTYYILTSTTSYLGRYAYLEVGYTF